MTLDDRIKQSLLATMSFVKEVCEDNKIKYYLIGGTFLGAVRHKGFIPWDDDIDIGIKRIDYERFYYAIQNSLNKRFKLLYFKNSNSYPYMYIKIYDTKTVLKESHIKKQNFQCGVFIDVFPLDYSHQNRLIELYRFYKVKYLKGIISNYYFKRSKKHNKFTWLIFTLRNLLLADDRRIAKITFQLDILTSKYSLNNTGLICNYYGAWGKKEYFPSELLENTQNYDFEHLKCVSFKDYNQYLTGLYGNYLVLPDESKRKSRHDFEVYFLED